MTDKATCCECGKPVSHDTGFTITGTLADNSEDRIYCPNCAPSTGKGYTIADLEAMKTNNQIERARYETSLIDLVGPDVYFFIKGNR